uniref:Uncharacterized protein n=1 Tax=Sphaerodactylus townsendi TaxID=933632 RepID=A0ACB8G6D5_9SAUR
MHTYALENQLAAKSDDMDQLKQALGDCAELPEAVVSRINELDRQRTRVVNQVAVLKASTKTALEEWRLYDDAWDDAGFVLARAFYCAELSKPPVITLETLKHQVGNLQYVLEMMLLHHHSRALGLSLLLASPTPTPPCQLPGKSLQDQAEGNEEVWTRLRTAGDNLKKLCDPSCSDLIDQKYKKVHTRWVLISEDTADQLQKARASLHLWESYAGLHAEVTAKLDKHQEQCASLLAATVPASGTRDFLRQKSQDIEKLQLGLQNVKASFHQAPELAEKIAQATEPAVQAFLPEKLQPLQRISYLEQMLQMKADEFQCTHSQLEDFENRLKQLEHRVKGTTEALANPDQGDEDSDLLLSQMLDLAALSPEMERLNEVSFRLPLGDFTAKRLQSLNWEWAQKRAMALEQCSKLQDVQSEDEFLLRCQRWVLFFEKMKERLKENVAGTLEELEKQQRDYEVTQAEISVHQPIFNSMVSKALHVVESGEAQNRAEFISKLTQLKEQWQGAVQAAQRRKSEIDGLVKRWHKFNNLLRDLTKFLKETQSFLAAVKSQDKYSLHQVQNLCHDFQYKQVLLWRWQTRCSLALDTGEELRDAADPEVKAVIQKESSQLQESWSNAQLQVEEIMKQLQGHLQTFESSERQTEGLHQRLQELKTRVKEPLPAEHDELQKAKEHMKRMNPAAENLPTIHQTNNNRMRFKCRSWKVTGQLWEPSLKELGTMKGRSGFHVIILPRRNDGSPKRF